MKKLNKNIVTALFLSLLFSCSSIELYAAKKLFAVWTTLALMGSQIDPSEACRGFPIVNSIHMIHGFKMNDAAKELDNAIADDSELEAYFNAHSDALKNFQAPYDFDEKDLQAGKDLYAIIKDKNVEEDREKAFLAYFKKTTPERALARLKAFVAQVGWHDKRISESIAVYIEYTKKYLESVCLFLQAPQDFVYSSNRTAGLL